MNRLNTYVFASSYQSGAASGPLALGCGEGVDEAIKDALARLSARFPAGRVASDPALQELELELARGTAALMFQREGDYPKQLGHDYMSNETMFAAAAFTSAAKDMEAVRALEEPTPVLVQQMFGQRLKRDVDRDIEPALVDWYEVMISFQADGEASQDHEESGFADSAPKEPDGRRIDDDVVAVLMQCSVRGSHVVLPPGRMDRGLYERVNDVLVALGGEWVGRKVQAHVFEDPPGPALEVAIGTRRFVKPQDFGYFPTPEGLANRLVDMADIRPGMKVLEPSAGSGSLALRAAKATKDIDLVTVVELLPANVRRLREVGFSAVQQVDFLSLAPVPIFDRVVMNPPFGGGADIAHVQHAARFLKPDGRLLAITSPSWTFRRDRKSVAFADFVRECQGEVQAVAKGMFAESGTNVATRIVVLEASRFPWNREHLSPDMCETSGGEETAVVRERMRG